MTRHFSRGNLRRYGETGAITCIFRQQPKLAARQYPLPATYMPRDMTTLLKRLRTTAPPGEIMKWIPRVYKHDYDGSWG